VVSQLQTGETDENLRKYLHLYLHGLFEKDPNAGKEYHGLQVELYADYEPRLLLPFLRSSHHYNLDKVICDSFRILLFLNFSHILRTELFDLLVLLRIGDDVMIVRSLLQVSGFSMTRRND
jgi:hypothetical protein